MHLALIEMKVEMLLLERTVVREKVPLVPLVLHQEYVIVCLYFCLILHSHNGPGCKKNQNQIQKLVRRRKKGDVFISTVILKNRER